MNGERLQENRPVVGDPNTATGAVKPKMDDKLLFKKSQDGSESQDSDADLYEIPSYHKKKAQRSHKRQQAVMGTASPSSTSIKGAPHPRKEFFVFRLEKSTSTEHLLNFVREKGIKPVDAVEVSHPHAKFKSFKLTVEVSDVDRVLDSDCWPRGIGVRRYRPSRSSDQPVTLKL